MVRTPTRSDRIRSRNVFREVRTFVAHFRTTSNGNAWSASAAPASTRNLAYTTYIWTVPLSLGTHYWDGTGVRVEPGGRWV